MHVSYQCPLPLAPVTESRLRSFFLPFGEVVDVTINRADFHQETGIHSGYGFIHYDLSHQGIHSAVAAAEAMKEKALNIDGMTLIIRSQLTHGLESYLTSPLPSPTGASAASNAISSSPMASATSPLMRHSKGGGSGGGMGKGDGMMSMGIGSIPSSSYPPYKPLNNNQNHNTSPHFNPNYNNKQHHHQGNTNLNTYPSYPPAASQQSPSSHGLSSWPPAVPSFEDDRMAVGGGSSYHQSIGGSNRGGGLRMPPHSSSNNFNYGGGNNHLDSTQHMNNLNTNNHHHSSSSSGGGGVSGLDPFTSYGFDGFK